MVELVQEKLKPQFIEQYKKEVRSSIAKCASTDSRLETSDCYYEKKIPFLKPESVEELRTIALLKLTYNFSLKDAKQWEKS